MKEDARRLIAGLLGIAIGLIIPTLNFDSFIPWASLSALAIALSGIVGSSDKSEND